MLLAVYSLLFDMEYILVCKNIDLKVYKMCKVLTFQIRVHIGQIFSGQIPFRSKWL